MDSALWRPAWFLLEWAFQAEGGLDGVACPGEAGGWALQGVGFSHEQGWGGLLLPLVVHGLERSTEAFSRVGRRGALVT